MIIKPSDRLNASEEYYFSKKLKEIARLNQSGNRVINLGIGSPDLMPPDAVINKLRGTATQSDAHGYQPYQGIPELREAIARFSLKHLSVELDQSEVLPLIGSKEGIMHISWSYLNPGDRVLIPSLGYPTYAAVTSLAGGVPEHFPLKGSEDWVPDWEYLENIDYTGVKLLWINYPHMPTGARGSVEIFARFIDLARRKQFLICHDNPYSFIQNDNPISILSLEGAREVCIELNSFSKTFNMAGWRIGWISGAREYLEPVLKVKSNMDSGMFRPLQLAAIEALNVPDSWFQEINQVYSQRKELVYKLLDLLKCSYSKQQSGLFIWARVPEGEGTTLSDELLYKARVFVTPGKIFGDQGKDYIRISLCTPADQLEEAWVRVSKLYN